MKLKINNKRKHELLEKDNVVGVGMGTKVVKGKQTGNYCITVLVSKKKPPKDLSSRSFVQKEVDGIQTDVVEVGVIKALPASKRQKPKKPLSNPDRYRPAPGGSSIGHMEVTAGTLGCVVYRDNMKYILSNNHVIANSNDAEIGDPILQPGPHDGGKIEDKIAELDKFIEVKLDRIIPDCSIANAALLVANFFTRAFAPKYKWSLSKASSNVNYVDAAIAKPINQNIVKDEILEIGKIKGTAAVEVGTKIQKTGRTTGYTTGSVTVVDAAVRVQYGLGKIALFENQIIAGPMSQGGDSGSAVLDMNNNLVGLLFAGSDQTTVMNPIDKVFELLKVNLKNSNL